jgi:CBS domain-containing protein
MTVAEILRHKGEQVVTLASAATLADAVALLVRERIGAVLVRDGEGPVQGIVSERDIVRSIAAHGSAALTTPVRELMSRAVQFCQPEDSIHHVMALMTERRFRHLPVQREGRLAGIVSIGDVVKLRIEQTEQEAQALRQYIATG